MRSMFGSHLSIAGGLTNALGDAQRLSLDCVQIFTANQRQWNPKGLDDASISAWHQRLKTMPWGRAKASAAKQAPAGAMAPASADVVMDRRIVSHNSYLINLASPDESLWERSVQAQRLELDRCEALGIRWCVLHPGAHMGTRSRSKPKHVARGEPSVHTNLAAFRPSEEPSPDEAAGITRVIKAVNRLVKETAGYSVTLCLETTAGSGTTLGYSFGQLARIRAGTKSPERVGFCLDTCHVTAAGYDLSTDDGAQEVLETFDLLCSLEALRVLHLNDSQGACGSMLDRHAHIGDGMCGKACFRTILNHPRLRDVPKILETPKGTDDRGRDWDKINIQRLKRLSKPGSACR